MLPSLFVYTLVSVNSTTFTNSKLLRTDQCAHNYPSQNAQKMTMLVDISLIHKRNLLM